MTRTPKRSRGSKRDHDGRDGRDGREGSEQEPFDDPEEHLEIERRRFRGGLPPTPEMYERAREQWKRLPGSLVRPPMDTVVGDSDAGKQQTPEQGQPAKKRDER
jgi:hypothetical protein